MVQSITTNIKTVCLTAFAMLALGTTSCQKPVPQGDYAIDIDTRYQQNEGWGVSLCWWANMCGRYDEQHVDSLINWLVSPEGLNYNIFRYNIGGGDDPKWRHCEEHHMGKGKGLRAEMEGFQDKRGGEYHWDRDQAQLRILQMIKQKRPDAIFEAFSNSAPYWMTYSGCVGGNTPATEDNLRPEYYEDFAHYLVDVCKHIKEEYGIEFSTLDPFNEPVTDYWYCSGSQEGCHFSTSAQIDFIKVLYPILKESGLKTVISASDETSVAQSTIDLRAYVEAGVIDMVGQWNTHTYQGNAEEKKELSQLVDSIGIHFWQSETGDGGRGIHGNLRMAQRLIEDVRCLKAAAWVDWQYVEVGSDQWSLVLADREWKQYTRHRNYYVRSHFSRFIPVGYTFVESSDPNSLAAVSPDGKQLVYVTLNAENEDTRFTVNVPESAKLAACYRTSETLTVAPSNDVVTERGIITMPMPALSIATLIFNIK
ncbi:MAG: glycoside hydrolase [Bacteroidales bacterium]|nr:glycoside hydrolase [Bacteroidales bacterium]